MGDLDDQMGWADARDFTIASSSTHAIKKSVHVVLCERVESVHVGLCEGEESLQEFHCEAEG